MLDLDAYLERIGLHGRPSIAQVHRAHLTSIPCENLDPIRAFRRRPHSLFVTGLIVGVRSDDGTGTVLCDWNELSLGEQTPTSMSVTALER